MLTELLSFLDELLSCLEFVRDVRGENGKLTGRSAGIERLTKKARALRDAVSVERQNTEREAIRCPKSTEPAPAALQPLTSHRHASDDRILTSHGMSPCRWLAEV